MSDIRLPANIDVAHAKLPEKYEAAENEWDRKTTELVLYDAMCLAIAAAYSVDEVKDIRHRAVPLELYARIARDVEAERQACEIRPN